MRSASESRDRSDIHVNHRHRIAIPQAELADLCRRHHIRKLSLFGSVLREDFGSDSDIDVLLEYEPDIPVGFRIFEIEAELSALMGGRRIDIVNAKFLNPRLRDRILSTAEVEYVQG